MNIVRCKVKSTHREEYLKKCEKDQSLKANICISL